MADFAFNWNNYPQTPPCKGTGGYAGLQQLRHIGTTADAGFRT